MVTAQETHVLNAETDSLFLQRGPKDGLWFQPFNHGDSIVVCAACRRVFFSDDFVSTCPICAHSHKLLFVRPNNLLAKEIVNTGGILTERPLRTERVRVRVPRQPRPEPVWKVRLRAALYLCVVLTAAAAAISLLVLSIKGGI
ncbi:MAG: hypothetical protein LBS21_05925 [Clostridiales bacterium]|jgi:hypothetical protein|nr:hypothetical protein [Clostridiales bacterium]